VGQLENVLNLHYDNPLMNARFFDFAPPITERTAEKLATIPRTALFKMKYGSPIRQITKYYPYRLHRTIFGEDAEQRLWFHPSDEAKFNAREARLVRDGLALEEEAAKAAGPLKRMFRFSHAACVFKILGPAVGFYIAYKALDKAREFYAKENGLGSRTLYAASDGLVDVVSAMWSPDLSGYSAELAKSLLHKGIDRLEKNKFSGYPEKQYFC
jgi:hypothetical protein